MRKLALLFVLMPIISLASPCVSYKENYALNANGASGTLEKVQIMNGNNYSITSTINVSKFFMSKTIVQTATGTCDANGNISAKSFSNSNVDNNAGPVALSNKELDPLSLVLFLSNALNANARTFPLISLLYNGNSISVQCAIINSNATVMSNDGQTVPATSIACVTPDHSIALNYSFDQSSSHTMLAANAIENGTTTMSALIAPPT